MPRVWHQPSLGRENIWMFHHLEHGKCLGTKFLLLPVLLWRHRVGGSKPNMVTVLVEHGLISSRLWYLAFFSFYYSSDSSFFWRRSSHYWAGHPTVRGPTVRQLAHSVYLMDTRIFLGTFLFFVFVLLEFASRLISFWGMQGMQLNLIISIWFLNCAQDFYHDNIFEMEFINSYFFCLGTIYILLRSKFW